MQDDSQSVAGSRAASINIAPSLARDSLSTISMASGISGAGEAFGEQAKEASRASQIPLETVEETGTSDLNEFLSHKQQAIRDSLVPKFLQSNGIMRRLRAISNSRQLLAYHAYVFNLESFILSAGVLAFVIAEKSVQGSRVDIDCYKACCSYRPTKDNARPHISQVHWIKLLNCRRPGEYLLARWFVCMRSCKILA